MTLSVKNLSIRINNRWYLRDFSLSAETGDTPAVIGTPGEHPQVLGLILAGALKPDEGSVELDGSDLSHTEVEFVRLLRPQQRKRLFGNRVEPIDDRLELIATALRGTRRIVVLESPFAGLSNFETNELTDIVRSAAADDSKIILILTHSPDEVFSLCSKGYVIQNSYIVDSGSPEELYRNPKCVGSAAALGNVNLIAAKRLTSNKKEIPEFFTVNGEHRLKTDHVTKGSLGTINQTVTLAIRPEDISLSFGASFPEDNLLKAKVADIKFMGSRTVIDLDAGGLILKGMVLRIVGLKVGDECMVGLPPDRIRVLKE